ncbi:MAG: hypothetical protein ACR2RE_29015, partial [Geminicoccaceae bacterium]
MTKTSRFAVICGVSLLALSTSNFTLADQEFTFDGGKYADFMAVIERNKARLNAARAEGSLVDGSEEARTGGVCTDGESSNLYA